MREEKARENDVIISKNHVILFSITSWHLFELKKGGTIQDTKLKLEELFKAVEEFKKQELLKNVRLIFFTVLHIS